jgi:hypothetical protein
MRKILLFLLVISSFTMNGQRFNEILKLTASDRGNAHSFGFSVNIDGDYAVIGALNAGSANNLFGQQGAAYIFKKDNNSNWQEIKKLSASDGFDMDNFGNSVDISGDYVIVGAYQDDEDVSGMNMQSAAGAAYIFKKDEGGTDNWGEVKKIVASDRDENDNFGRSVSISGNYAVIGADAEKHDVNGMNSKSFAGSAYIFEKDEGGMDNWGEVKKIVASDRNNGDKFGRRLTISGEYIAIGAHAVDEDANGTNSLNNAGAVYLFNKNEGGTDNWGEVKKIVASDRGAFYSFGYDVVLSDDYLLVGSAFADIDTISSNQFISAGAAYVFNKNEGGTDNWGEVKKIIASDGGDGDSFGYSVDISGDNIIVGAYQEDEDLDDGNTLSNAGSAYVFNKNEGGMNNWGETQKIVSDDRAGNDRFGFNVAIEGDFIMIGATGESEDSTGGNTVSSAGSVYVFEFGIPSATTKISNNYNLKIFPNPVQENLFIESEQAIEKILIYNILGQPLQQFSAIRNTQFSVNVNDFPKGIYILQILGTNGQIVRKEFIKQ